MEIGTWKQCVALVCINSKINPKNVTHEKNNITSNKQYLGDGVHTY